MSSEVTVVTDEGSVDLDSTAATGSLLPVTSSHRIVDRGADTAVLPMLIAVPSP